MENKRESLKPIFIHQIFKSYTDRDHPCTMKFVQERLAEEFGISIQRQALSKIIHLMAEEDLFIFGDPGSGYYYDRYGYHRTENCLE